MDGHFNLCGNRRIPLQKDGKQYMLTVRKLRDYALKEAAILSTVGNPYAGIESIKDETARVQALRVAADYASRPQIVAFPDEHRFDQSFRGLAYNIWRCLSDEHPTEFPKTATLEQGIQLGMDFIEWFGADRIEELVKALEETKEQDTVKNSNGQEATAQKDQ